MQTLPIPAEIQAIVTRQVEAWAKGDAATFVSDFALDANFVSVRGDLIQGRSAIQANHAFIFNGPYRNTRLSETIDVLHRIAPNAAVAHIAVEVSGVAAFPPGITPSAPGVLSTRMLFVFVQQEGAWQITSAQNTIVVPQVPPKTA